VGHVSLASVCFGATLYFPFLGHHIPVGRIHLTVPGKLFWSVFPISFVERPSLLFRYLFFPFVTASDWFIVVDVLPSFGGFSFR
jgi:hypothetical protein